MKLGPSHASGAGLVPLTPHINQNNAQWDNGGSGSGGGWSWSTEGVDSRGRPSLGSVIPFYAPSTSATGSDDTGTEKHATVLATEDQGRDGLAARYNHGDKLPTDLSAKNLMEAGCVVGATLGYRLLELGPDWKPRPGPLISGVLLKPLETRCLINEVPADVTSANFVLNEHQLPQKDEWGGWGDAVVEKVTRSWSELIEPRLISKAGECGGDSNDGSTNHKASKRDGGKYGENSEGTSICTQNKSKGGGTAVTESSSRSAGNACGQQPKRRVVRASYDASDSIRKQLEYYFSPRNLSRDSHLRSLQSVNKEGWVALEALLEFPKLAAMARGAPAGAVATVAAAVAGDGSVRSDKASTILELDPARLRIRVRSLAA